ncbi:Positive regulator of purine utilization [Cladobotryum mycophilum]|uniref:Positive regulator of purine utilization n=1 Tax=Cladobotryum mycophilum TaxID=491253 RepID=A0ABR0T3D6_9HYPO
MPTHGPPSPSPQPNVKRQRQSFDETSPRNGHTSPSEHLGDIAPGGATVDAAGAALGVTTPTGAGAGAGLAVPASVASTKAGQSSNFRNVSACNRCRLRKNRCDQKLPSCASCAKAGVACVGYDPITKKEIPRSYVFYLETRVEQLEKLLASNNIPFPPAEDLELCSRPSVDSSSTAGVVATTFVAQSDNHEHRASRPQAQGLDPMKPNKQGGDQSPAMMNIVSSSKPRSLASASGVSFARVVFAAVQYSVSDHHGTTDRSGHHLSSSGGGTSMRDSFFGLHTKPTIQPATFPDKDVAARLVTLYFEHANPQIPILHRGEFMRMFELAYMNDGPGLGAREQYMLNMVFAIGCGVIVGEPVKTEASGGAKLALNQGQNPCQPEEYHASAIVHLEACLSSSGGGLEVLQAVLLLANFALLRPVPPGLWYITGVAVRLAVDLGLHYEDGGDIESTGPDADGAGESRDSANGSERGRRLWIRDLRRRLWWCTYSFDRLVSTCVGRPFGISDQVITTELPSVLDDNYITPNGFLMPPGGEDQPSYKHVAHHYFRLRTLQSEILQVLQYNQAQMAKAGSQARTYPEMSRHMPSPYLVQFDSFRSWRIDIDRRLLHWKTSAPTRLETGVAFSTEFLELNYWQAIILLYRQSLSIPAMFEGEYNTSNEVNSPTAFTAELREDEDRIYLKVAEAGQKILRIYRQLHLSGLVSYTYLSTHHLFMAGISYLYAIWHSPIVRGRLTMDEVDFTVLAAKSVFTDMIDKCPPAETCRDAFDRTAKATIKMASSSGGFGLPTQQSRRPRRETTNWTSTLDSSTIKSIPRHRHHQSEQGFPFDMSIPDNLSSPSLSTAGDVSTPPLGKAKPFDTQSRGRGHPGLERAASHDGTAIDPALVPSPPVPRRVDSQRPTSGGGNSFMGQHYGVQSSMEYQDPQSMDFLQTLGTSANGFGSVDQGQMDLGFGLSWESMHNDYGEGGQQINPFDTFFFGGQQSGNGSGSNGTSGPPSGGNDSGGPMAM